MNYNLEDTVLAPFHYGIGKMLVEPNKYNSKGISVGTHGFDTEGFMSNFHVFPALLPYNETKVKLIKELMYYHPPRILLDDIVLFPLLNGLEPIQAKSTNMAFRYMIGNYVIFHDGTCSTIPLRCVYPFTTSYVELFRELYET